MGCFISKLETEGLPLKKKKKSVFLQQKYSIILPEVFIAQRNFATQHLLKDLKQLLIYIYQFKRG